MISIRNIKTIFKKEFLQIMRDKSALFTNFFVPLFGLPLYAVFIMEASSYTAAKKGAPLRDNTVFTVSYQGDLDVELIQRLEQDKKIKLAKLNSSLNESGIREHIEKFTKYNSLVDLGAKLKDKLTKDKTVLKENNTILAQARSEYISSLDRLVKKNKAETDLHVAVFKNEKNTYSTYFFHSEEIIVSNAALKYVKDQFKEYEASLVEQYKLKKNIGKSDLDPFEFWGVNLDKSTNPVIRIVGLGLGGGILFLLLIAIFNPTINTTIGERDQNTFKVLLMNPISLHEIFIGKYLNVALQGLLTLIPYSIESLILYAWGNSNYLFQMLPELTFLKLMLVFLGTVSAAIFISSMCFLACSFAKTRVQAQSLLTLLMFAIIIPIGTVGVMDIKLSTMTAMIPLINFPIATENLMMASPNYSAIALGILVNFATSMILVWFSLGAFLVQWKGSSSTISLSDLLTFKKRKTTSLTPAHAFLAFAIAFLGYTYGGIVISTLKVDLLSFLFSPILFCLGTAIFITQYSGLDFTTTFRWKGLDWKYALKIIPSAFALSFAFNLFFQNSPVLEVFKIGFPVIFESNQFATYVSYFLLFAVIPGFTEEVLFRGIIFKGLRTQYSLLISTIISSALFAIIHFSMFKWGHTLAVGLFLAVMYERRGLVACIFFHMVFNGSGLLLGMNESLASVMVDIPSMASFVIIPGAFIFSYFMLIPKNKEEHLNENVELKEAA
jgi:membrane protease YdiL (CAAX protease family)/ABC-type Na+ efflux pump permease subunit